MTTPEHDERDPQADFAEAVGNGAIHPAVAGMFAHLDNRLSDLLDRQDPAKVAPDGDDDDAGDDAGDKTPSADSNASAPGRKATPASVAGKAGSK